MQVVGRIVNGKYVREKRATKRQREELQQMLEHQSPPRIMTDDVFLSGVGTLDQQIKDPHHLNHIISNAKKNGYTPKPTDYYVASLAKFPGDPAAFLNHGEARGKARKVLEQRGESAEGAVNVKGREPESDPHEPIHKLNPKIVDRIAKRKIRENPDLAKLDKRDLAADIVAKHGKQN